MNYLICRASDDTAGAPLDAGLVHEPTRILVGRCWIDALELTMARTTLLQRQSSTISRANDPTMHASITDSASVTIIEDDRSSYLTLAMHNESRSDTSPSGSSQDLLHTDEHANEKDRTRYVAAPPEEFTAVRHVPDRSKDTLRVMFVAQHGLANGGGQWREQIVDSTLAQTSSTGHRPVESRTSDFRSRAKILPRENRRLLLPLRHSRGVREGDVFTCREIETDFQSDQLDGSIGTHEGCCKILSLWILQEAESQFGEEPTDVRDVLVM